jgi:hypothetical protein
MLLESCIRAESLFTTIASVRPTARVSIQMDLQLCSTLELFIAIQDRTGQLGSGPRLTGVSFNVFPQIIFSREHLVAELMNDKLVDVQDRNNRTLTSQGN